MTNAEKYVLAAYLVFLAAVLSYLVIIALKVGRLEQELAGKRLDGRLRELREALA